MSEEKAVCMFDFFGPYGKDEAIVHRVDIYLPDKDGNFSCCHSVEGSQIRIVATDNNGKSYLVNDALSGKGQKPTTKMSAQNLLNEFRRAASKS